MDSELETTLDGISTETEQPVMVEIDWQQVALDELKKGYLRQSDYTKKTQEIADLRKKMETPDDDDPVRAADSFLQERGYLTKSQLKEEQDVFARKLQEEREFEKLLEFYPQLKDQQEAIKAIARSDNSALEDIVVKYKFLSSDKLKKAKERPIVWSSGRDESKPIDIDSMTREQYAKFKAEKGIGKKGSFDAPNRSL